MKIEKMYNKIVSIANKYKADRHTNESAITIKIEFEKFIEMDRLIRIGEATEKAYQNGYIIAYGINRHAEKFDIDTAEDLLEWAEGIE